MRRIKAPCENDDEGAGEPRGMGRTTMNWRKCSTELSCDDIKEPEAAKDHARVLGLELNTHLTFAPYSDSVAIPSAPDIAATFDRLLKHLTGWVRRHTRKPFTYIRVAHSSDDSTGRNPLRCTRRDHRSAVSLSLPSLGIDVSRNIPASADERALDAAMPPVLVASRSTPSAATACSVCLLRLVPRDVIEGATPVAALMANAPVGTSDNLCNQATAVGVAIDGCECRL